MADTYFTRTPGSAGNRRTFTWSAWLKRSGLGSTNRMWSAGTSIPTNNDNLSSFIFNSDDTMTFFGENGGSQSFQVKTSQVFRDTSAWYHIVLAVDTTQATASNRVKFYVNGSQVTDFSTASYMSQNYDTFFNATNLHVIGYSATAATFNGYMAHVNFTDGTAYDASAFGETDTNGQWAPIPTPSVTYGTNGFFLKFASSGSLGTDSSGNGNDFTKNGSGDQVTDTPDNVFATWNALDKSTSVPPTLSLGNTTLSQPNSGLSSNTTLGVSSGQWYFECKVTGISAWLGVVPQNLHPASSNLFTASNTAGVYGNIPNLYLNGSSQGSLGGGVSNGDILMIAFDIDNGNFYVGKNGLWNDGLGGGFDQADFANATAHSFTVKTGDNYVVGTVNGSGSTSYVLDINFGNGYFGTTAVSSGNADDAGIGTFEYAPPTGYYALCTKNIASYG